MDYFNKVTFDLELWISLLCSMPFPCPSISLDVVQTSMKDIHYYTGGSHTCPLVNSNYYRLHSNPSREHLYPGQLNNFYMPDCKSCISKELFCASYGIQKPFRQRHQTQDRRKRLKPASLFVSGNVVIAVSRTQYLTLLVSATFSWISGLRLT